MWLYISVHLYIPFMLNLPDKIWPTTLLLLHTSILHCLNRAFRHHFSWIWLCVYFVSGTKLIGKVAFADWLWEFWGVRVWRSSLGGQRPDPASIVLPTMFIFVRAEQWEVCALSTKNFSLSSYHSTDWLVLPILLFWRIPHSNWTHRFWLYKCWGICMTATCLLTCRLHNCQSSQFIIERPRPPMARQLIQKTPVVRQPGSHSVFEFMSVFSLTCCQQNHLNLAFNGPAGNAVAPMINVDLTRMCNNHPTFPSDRRQIGRYLVLYSYFGGFTILEKRRLSP